MRRRKAETFNEDGVAAWSEEPRHLGLESRGARQFTDRLGPAASEFVSSPSSLCPMQGW